MWKLIMENAISGQGIGLFSLFLYQYKNKWKFSPSICTDMMDKIPVIALLGFINATAYFNSITNTSIKERPGEPPSGMG
jgi:hypothetical protein